MGLNVVQAKVSCNTHFIMESTLELNNTTPNNIHGQEINEHVLREAILKSIGST